MKDFNLWNKNKIKIDSYKRFQHPKEREIWWCRLGINIGTEVYGKGSEFTRPVLIINTDGSENCICIPMSSKIKTSKYSCVVETETGKINTALVFQIRSIDKRRLKKKICTLSEDEYTKVQKYFEKIWKI